MASRKIKASKKTMVVILLSTAAVSMCTAFFVIRFMPSFAAGSSSFTFTPTSYNQAINTTFNVPVYMSVSSDTANAVQLDISYNSTGLQLNSYNAYGTNCSSPAGPPTNNAGSLILPLNCSTPVTSSNVLITTLNFTAKTAGTHNITFNPKTTPMNGTYGSNGSTMTDIPATFTNATVSVVDTVNSITVSSNKNKLMTVSSNYVTVSLNAKNASNANVAGKAITVSGLRAGDTISPSSGTVTDASGNISYTLKATTTGTINLTFTADGKTGTLATVTVYKTGDISTDGNINLTDAAAVMANWGTSPANTFSDINCDGAVNITDSGIVMANWGI